ncbi:hypothetical protein [Rhodococcus sp. 14-2496-1d]|nr:hypothetical protein [Rhodococcus sp. 14-2496-1d]
MSDTRDRDLPDDEREIYTCQGCGKYSFDSGWHVRNGEDCGEFL